MNMLGEQRCRYGDPVKSELDPLAVQHASRVNSAINNHEGQFAICERELTGLLSRVAMLPVQILHFLPSGLLMKAPGRIA